MRDEAELRDHEERVRDAVTFGAGSLPAARRSSKWRAAREKFLQANPSCALCGGLEDLDVHHCLPFHLFPSSELDPRNLLAVCRSGPAGVNCHLLMHGGVWRDYVPDAARQAARLRKMLDGRVRG